MVGGRQVSYLALVLCLAAGLLVVHLGCDGGTDGDGDVDSDVDSDSDSDSDADVICTDECTWADDGECDDGAAGSTTSACDFGTDCTDCGERRPGDCVPYCGPEEAPWECGDDGCGGSCGECAGGEVCDWGGECCAPDCTGRVCGSDGCGGDCGECGETEFCTDDGACAPCSCAGRACGYDECGNSCGECGVGQACDSLAGTCSACTCAAGVECGYDDALCNCGACATGMCDERTNTCDPAATAMCNNTCRFAGDGDCDDGGRGCDFSLCDFGSDCEDCGARTEADRLPEGTGCGEG